MKNLFIFSFLLFTTSVFAQNMNILNESNENVSNTTINMEGGTSGELVFEFKIQNNTAIDISAKIELFTISEVSGTINSLCISGTCLMPGQTVSPDFNLTANNATDGFSFHYTPFGHEGVSSYRLRVSNNNNSSDTVNVIVTFNTSNSAVENVFGNIIASDIYPNPAGSQASIDYNLPSGSSLDIVVYDMLGKEVKSFELESSGILRMPLGDLERGTYFCRYLLDDRLVETQKLIVK